jgi:hypothetical protein
MMGKLHLDLFGQEKYLLNHVNLKIKLRRSRDVFALMADADNYKIKIKGLALFVDTSFPYWYRVPYNCEYNLRFQIRVVAAWRESVVRPRSVPQN